MNGSGACLVKENEDGKPEMNNNADIAVERLSPTHTHSAGENPERKESVKRRLNGETPSQSSHTRQMV